MPEKKTLSETAKFDTVKKEKQVEFVHTLCGRHFLQNLFIKINYLTKKENTMSADKEKTAKGDLGLLEEDDEFEEFPAEGM